MKKGENLARFVLVGGGTAALYFVLNWFCQSRLGLKPYMASMLSYVPCFVLAYALQRNWAFRSAQSHASTLPRYALVQLVVAVLTAILTQMFAHFSNADHVFIAGVSTLIASGVSFVLTSTWVFRSSHGLLG